MAVVIAQTIFVVPAYHFLPATTVFNVLPSIYLMKIAKLVLIAVPYRLLLILPLIHLIKDVIPVKQIV